MSKFLGFKIKCKKGVVTLEERYDTDYTKKKHRLKDTDYAQDTVSSKISQEEDKLGESGWYL